MLYIGTNTLRITQRLDQARGAFDKQDIASSRKLHDTALIAGTEHDKARKSGRDLFGQYIKSIIYGGLDGIITTFAVVSGVAGANLGVSIILILGIANLLADGFSMGTGDYLSTKSEREFYDKEARRQAWENTNIPAEQRAELEALYRQHGYTADEAQTLAEIQSRQPGRWVNTMMIEELNMLKEDDSPFYNAIATFLSFIVAGSLPLVVYIVGLFVPIPANTAFVISVLSSGLALFSLGAAKVFVTRLNPIRSGVEMLIVGGFAAAVAYIVGAVLKNIGG